ncbi:MAG: DsbA family protein [Candidatus Acetothermia bacterium]|jgi:protein-disulfide isomerase|nr:DsbA family protein [Candidatus Acetothermia bacterium]MDH7505127.1 thioredoxin domain-containing protein [Candidatus Acetothermia bacterium]
MREKRGRLLSNPILLVVIGALLVAAVLIVASQFSARRNAVVVSPETGATQQESELTQPEKPVTPQTILAAQPTKGSPDAPVTIIEFAEFYCPYCARYLWETYPRIESDYISKGLVKYEFRNLVVHGQPALLTGAAGECAQQQGKFWPFHDRLFETVFPGKNVSQSKVLGLADLKGVAAAVGLDTAQFNRCLEGYDTKFNSCYFDYNNCTGAGTDEESCAEAFNACLTANEMFQRLLEDQEDLGQLIENLPAEEQAQAQRIGTPTFFINGHILIGAQPYESFKRVIDRELARVQGQ